MGSTPNKRSKLEHYRETYRTALLGLRNSTRFDPIHPLDALTEAVEAKVFAGLMLTAARNWLAMAQKEKEEEE